MVRDSKDTGTAQARTGTSSSRSSTASARSGEAPDQTLPGGDGKPTPPEQTAGADGVQDNTPKEKEPNEDGIIFYESTIAKIVYDDDGNEVVVMSDHVGPGEKLQKDVEAEKAEKEAKKEQAKSDAKDDAKTDAAKNAVTDDKSKADDKTGTGDKSADTQSRK